MDGRTVSVDGRATILEACDAAGRYVPRLCYYPDLGCGAGCAAGGRPAGARECGLCAVRITEVPSVQAGGPAPTGDDPALEAAGPRQGTVALACTTPAASALAVCTDDEGLRALRRERLASILAGHPHVCLGCPDRDGCTREECSYGNPPDARCCDESGRCELGKLVEWLDPQLQLPRRAVAVSRAAMIEGRMRREPGLCIACGRCVRVCGTASQAGAVLELPASGTAARPKRAALVDSGCMFCGLCVLVCPAGAVTAPGEAGARWLADRREKAGLKAAVLPPETRLPFDRENVAVVAEGAGVFRLLDPLGKVVLIRGVADLRAGLLGALDDPACAVAVVFQLEVYPLYTQRESELLAQHVKEHGSLPPANDLGNDLFDD